MPRNINNVTSAINFCVEEKSSNKSNSKESQGEKAKPRDILNKDLNKSSHITKLCSKADMKIKVLLSNTVVDVSSSTSKLSSLTFGTMVKRSSCDILSPIPKPVSLCASKHSSVKKTSKYKSSRDEISDSHHFNTEVDVIDDATNKQHTVVKILRLQNLARKMEERLVRIIKNKFESNVYHKSYTNGLEEGFRYGYFIDPSEVFNTQSELTRKSEGSTDDLDKNIYKSSELQMIENKESERMRGGCQYTKQQEVEVYSQKKSESTIGLSKSLMELKPSRLTVIHEYPNKCTENINEHSYKEKYATEYKEEGRSKLPATVKFLPDELNEIDRGGQYLQYFEKMLHSVGDEFAEGFRAGFGDGFVAANIFLAVDTTFAEDEKEYISKMRYILKFADDDLKNDINKLQARAAQMKQTLNFTPEEFQDICVLIEKGVNEKKNLKFSMNDYKFYNQVNKKDKKYVSTKSMYEDESDVQFSTFGPERGYVPQHTKNRAARYISDHRINDFFQFLGSHLIASKPEDPIAFLINLLDKCIDYRFNEFIIQAPLLFTKKHVESVYYVLDPMNTGFIDICQYVHGMEALGIKDVNLSYFRPGEKIDKYVFLTNACRRLLCKFREMIAMNSITTSKTAYNTVEAN